MYGYEQSTGRIQALKFKLLVNGAEVGFSLPVEWRCFQAVLQHQRVTRWRDEDYVYRVAQYSGLCDVPTGPLRNANGRHASSVLALCHEPRRQELV